MYDSLRDEIERLYAEITITERKLSTASEEASKQHDTFVRGLRPADQQLEPIFQALTQVELAAQQLVARAHWGAPTVCR
jgi:hypothetical protein